MSYKLRTYQQDLKSKIYKALSEGFKAPLAVMPTGSGKAVTLCSIAYDLAIGNVFGQSLPTVISVHRKELVSQLCVTLSRAEVQHNIIAPRNVINNIIAAQRRATGKQWYNHRAPITVVSVDTFNSRVDQYKTLIADTRVWIQDEAAHVLKDNKWGKALTIFPNAVGIGFTATPQRLDKRGLGTHADGLFDTMIIGPSTKFLINEGYLSKYKIVVPPGDYEQHLKKAGDGSDFTREAMAIASRDSHVVGDVVKNYIKFAKGKQAIVFASDTLAATKMEAEFLANKIPAKTLTGETPDKERTQGVIDFEDEKIKVLINVDLFDEGFDVPGIECVIMARPTMSVGKYLQMVGRGLRIKKGKQYALIIDHVGNIRGAGGNHGLPDQHRLWTLDRIVKRRDSTNLLRICANVTCNSPYDRVLEACPYCNWEAVKMYNRSGGERDPRAALKLVDGDLTMIDPETLAELYAEVQLESPDDIANRVAMAGGQGAGIRMRKLQMLRIEKQQELAQVISLWAGKMRHHGYSDRQSHKKFFLTYDLSITGALSLKTNEMESLMRSIKDEIGI